jgi:alkanesulfonate monooxygenase SsuD/methylene tetrahydromethanopterin reductase-like flavin-dependent oxidoreductase (luciferase family)
MRISISVDQYADSAEGEESARRVQDAHGFQNARRGQLHAGVAELDEVATAAEGLGIDTVWIADRLLGGGAADDGTGARDGLLPAGSPDEELLTAYATLGFLASRTERVRLGAMVGPAGRLAAGPLVRAVGVLDVFSGGRVRLGVGAEAAEPALGAAPSAPAAEFERIEDLLRVAHLLWADDRDPSAGLLPVPAEPYDRPYPPVLIAGHGEARMLPLVARYADACDLLDDGQGDAALSGKLDVLAVQCRKAGRAVGEIDVSVGVRLHPGESAAELIARCRHLAELGIGHVLLSVEGSWSAEALRTLADTAPAVRALHGDPHGDPHHEPERGGQFALLDTDGLSAGIARSIPA